MILFINKVLTISIGSNSNYIKLKVLLQLSYTLLQYFLCIDRNEIDLYALTINTL